MTEAFALEMQEPQPSPAERAAFDAYDTPQPLARALCRVLAGLIQPLNILEPSAGTGVFLREAREVWRSAFIAGMDVVPRGLDIDQGDFLALEPSEVRFALVLGNPPWSLALEFVEHALRLVPVGGHVAFLLRTSFWHGQERVDRLYARHPARWWLPLRERPSYTADGKTDNVDSALFVWERGYCGHTEVLRHLSWRAGRG